MISPKGRVQVEKRPQADRAFLSPAPASSELFLPGPCDPEVQLAPADRALGPSVPVTPEGESCLSAPLGFGLDYIAAFAGRVACVFKLSVS